MARFDLYEPWNPPGILERGLDPTAWLAKNPIAWLGKNRREMMGVVFDKIAESKTPAAMKRFTGMVALVKILEECEQTDSEWNSNTVAPEPLTEV